MPLVSVIIPNYNHARFLYKRFESVLGQTVQDIEIIYLDDASSDNSNEVFQRFANDPRIHSIINKTNSGSTFKQWNKGIKQSKGKYIWIAESDDYADPRFLEILIAQLNDNPNIGVAYCQSWIVDENDELHGIHEETDDNLLLVSENRWKHSYICSGRDQCTNYQIYVNTIVNASGALFKRSVVEKTGLADDSFKICGDWLFWSKILLNTDVAFIAQPLNYFRRHNGTVRVARTKDGTLMEESYRVVSYLADALDIEEAALEKIRESYCATWIWVTRTIGIDIRKQICILKAAKRMDPYIIGRCARHLIAGLSRRVIKRKQSLYTHR